VRTHRPTNRDHDELLDAATDVAANLRAYGSYGGSSRKALAALKRRRPGFSPAAYQTALDAGIAVFDAGQSVVDEYLSSRRPSGSARTDLVNACARRLAQRHPGFRAATYEWLVSWIYLYFHEM
jgi:hypothetical protein